MGGPGCQALAPGREAPSCRQGAPQAQAAGAGALVVPGFEQPLLLDTALSGAPVVVPLGFDATGAAALTVVSPGFAQTIDATAQVAFVSTADVLGASAPLALQLGP